LGLLNELSAIKADIKAIVGEKKFEKAYDQATKGMRLIEGYSILVPTDNTFEQSGASLNMIRNEIDSILIE
jgi:hypothetical protein